MRYEIETIEYDTEFFGKPWIATVTFGSDPMGRFTWGVWLGTAGEAGVLVIDAKPGDIVAAGQKSHRPVKQYGWRKGRPGWMKWYIAGDEGQLLHLPGGQGEAYKRARAKSVPASNQ